MAEYTGSYYSEGYFLSKKSLPFLTAAFETGTCYYEVMRVTEGNCLFLEDHLDRLRISVSLVRVNLFIRFSGSIAL